MSWLRFELCTFRKQVYRLNQAVTFLMSLYICTYRNLNFMSRSGVLFQCWAPANAQVTPHRLVINILNEGKGKFIPVYTMKGMGGWGEEWRCNSAHSYSRHYVVSCQCNSTDVFTPRDSSPLSSRRGFGNLEVINIFQRFYLDSFNFLFCKEKMRVEAASEK